MTTPQGPHPQPQHHHKPGEITRETTRRPTHPPPKPPPAPPARPKPAARTPLLTLLKVTSIAGGIQFGWALQLSLLTPYVQELGIPHAFASIIWLCGPISGFFVQPLVGHISDRTSSSFGRRRPFILSGAVLIIVAVLVVGFSADIGYLFGDDVAGARKRPRAIVAFVIGFWLLDVANNTTQGPCRALLADLTGKDPRRNRVANAYYSLFMAVGNILGFATGSYTSWYTIFPFTLTRGCGESCANLKSAFLIDIIFIAITTYISITAIQEVPLTSRVGSGAASQGPQQSGGHAEEAFFWELFGTFKYLPGPVWLILSVTALTWIGWFPFLLFDTDWMGREVYGGDPDEAITYHKGVSTGSLGLMLQSVVLAVTSVLMEKLCRKLGSGILWGISNIIMSLCFIAMIVIAFVVSKADHLAPDFPPNGAIVAAVVVFTILGMPLAVTYSVPYALITARIESLGLGQGLSMGVLNLAIVTPQVIVSLGSGPWDQLFGGGNSPSIAVAAVASFASGLMAILVLPRSRAEKTRTLGMHV